MSLHFCIFVFYKYISKIKGGDRYFIIQNPPKLIIGNQNPLRFSSIVVDTCPLRKFIYIYIYFSFCYQLRSNQILNSGSSVPSKDSILFWTSVIVDFVGLCFHELLLFHPFRFWWRWIPGSRNLITCSSC